MKKTYSMFSIISVAAVMLLLVFSPSAYGQGSGSDKWEFMVAPYFWAAGIDGDMKVKENEVDIDVGFSDILDVLEFGGSVHAEAKKGRWGAFADLMYLSLSTDKELKPTTAEMDMDLWTIELGGFYQIGNWKTQGGSGRTMTLDVLGGGRYWEISSEIDIGPINREKSVDWIDPFVGARFIAEMKDWLIFHVRGDIGGFGVSSDASEFTWNIYAGPAFKVSDKVTIVAGYRALGLEKERGNDLEMDITMHGPQVGVAIRF